MRRALAGLIAALALLGPGAAVAVAACPQTSVADIEDEVMCPVCGTPLSLAIEAPQARREREFIVELVERCQSKAAIKAALAAEFGASVLAVPADEGAGRAAWLVPVLMLLLTTAGVAAATLRWRWHRPAAAGGPHRDADPAVGDDSGEAEGERSARVEADLARYDL